MRSMRSELASAATVLAVPTALFLAFPYGALGFRAVESSRQTGFSAAFVSLSPKQEKAAVSAAKSSLHGDVGVTHHMRIDMPFGDLPEAPPNPVMSVGERTRLPESGVVECEITPYLPSRAAPSPRLIPPEPEPSDKNSFSRKEMLKID